jgi:hypothetical protein
MAGAAPDQSALPIEAWQLLMGPDAPFGVGTGRWGFHERINMKKVLLLLASAAAACTGDDPAFEEKPEETTSASTALVTRRLPDKATYGRLEPGAVVERIVVKLHEGTHARLRAGVLEARPQDRSVREQATLARIPMDASRRPGAPVNPQEGASSRIRSAPCCTTPSARTPRAPSGR